VKVTTAVEGEPTLVLSREGRVNFKPDAADGEHAPDAGAATFVYAGWPAQILMAPCHVGERAHIEATLTDLQMRSVTIAQTIRIAVGTPVARCN
jgi:hypothetical protein